MKRRIVQIVLVLALVLLMVPMAAFAEDTAPAVDATEPTTEAPAEDEAAWVNPFTDVKEGDWYFAAVQYVSEKGLMDGATEDTFAPKGEVTRGMFVEALYRLSGAADAEVPAEGEEAADAEAPAEGEEAADAEVPAEGEEAAAAETPAEGEEAADAETPAEEGYTDVPADHPYAAAIKWATDNKVVQGYGEGIFGADDVLTREQMVVIFYNYAKLMGQETPTEGMAIDEFEDKDQVAEWALEAMRWAIGAGIISGDEDGLIAPKESGNRAQTATILMRFIEGPEEEAPAEGEDATDAETPAEGEDAADAETPAEGEDAADAEAPAEGEDAADAETPAEGETAA